MKQITSDNYKEYFERLGHTVVELENCGNDFAKEIVSKLRLRLQEKSEGADTLMADNATLKIGVVGQVKAGKSSFLNSLFFDGENVLPRASTPMTAGLTVLEYGEESKFIVEYYNTKEWESFEARAKEYDQIVDALRPTMPNMSEVDIIKMSEQKMDMAIKTAKELVTSCGRSAKSKIKDESLCEETSFKSVSDLQDILEKYVGAHGEYTPIVKCLVIKMHDDRLKGIRIVDTPGVNDPVVSREHRTREFLRGCHGVFFLSYSGRFFDSTDVDFLSNRIGSEGVGTVVLIASKFDSVLQDEGVKFKDDLEGVINHCERQLKAQYATNIKTSSFNGHDPIFTFSSGIGFSIFKKPMSRLDEMERHVVSRMKEYYPSFFQTEKDIKDIFLDLSQIPTIREEYLENVFTKNKDKIIAEKISAYFSSVSDELRNEAIKGKNELETKLEVLSRTEANDLQAKKESTEKAVRKIENGIETVGNRIGSNANSALRDCTNSCAMSVPSVPTQTVSESFIRISTFWGNNKSFEASYQKVDISRLIDTLQKNANQCVESLLKKWGAEVDKLREFLRSEIDKQIVETEQTDNSGKFDADVLRNILYDVTDSMMANGKLSKGEIVNSFVSKCFSRLQGLDNLGYTSQCFDGEDAKGRDFVRKCAENCRYKVQSECNTLVVVFNQELEDQLDKAKQNVVRVVTDNKQKFINEINSKSEAFLCELEKQIQEKEKNLEALESAIRSVETFISNL